MSGGYKRSKLSLSLGCLQQTTKRYSVVVVEHSPSSRRLWVWFPELDQNWSILSEKSMTSPTKSAEIQKESFHHRTLGLPKIALFGFSSHCPGCKNKARGHYRRMTQCIQITPKTQDIRNLLKTKQESRFCTNFFWKIKLKNHFWHGDHLEILDICASNFVYSINQLKKTHSWQLEFVDNMGWKLSNHLIRFSFVSGEAADYFVSVHRLPVCTLASSGILSRTK